MGKFIQLHEDDNVVVVILPTSCCPAGHKMAIKPIPAGSPIIKYGFAIGIATQDIAPGEHVHIHNVKPE